MQCALCHKKIVRSTSVNFVISQWEDKSGGYVIKGRKGVFTCLKCAKKAMVIKLKDAPGD
jgi:hypothetical protein